MSFNIKICPLKDAKAYTDHCLTHMQEKGIGDIYVHPFSSSHKWDKEEYLNGLIDKWSLPPFAPNWEIAWVAEINEKFVGHLNLRCGGIDALKHRMRLGMGIEKPYRSIGIGKALVEAATQWARKQEQIFWIDLSVFSKNVPARKLYERFNFLEAYLVEDALRVDGEIIDDIQ